MSETATTEAPATVPVEITSRWNGASVLFRDAHTSRKSSPRATTPLARAKLVHTSHGGRQLVVYVTPPLMATLRWLEGGRIEASWGGVAENLLVRLTPGHAGVRLHPETKKTRTCRLVISGDFIAPSACAPVREVPHEISGSVLTLGLPRAWANPKMAKAWGDAA